METFATIFKNSSATCMARLVGDDTELIVQSDLSTITYSIFLLDDHAPDSRTSVSGHSNQPVLVSDVIFDTLQTDQRWTTDETGYNFRHTIDTSSSPAFTIAGRNYLVEYLLTPGDGPTMVVRFRFHCI
jgi:hypothetical protein